MSSSTTTTSTSSSSNNAAAAADMTLSSSGGGSDVFVEDAARYFDAQAYPPTVVLWFTSAVDSITTSLTAGKGVDWRQALGITSPDDNPWLYPTVPSTKAVRVDLLTFPDFCKQQQQQQQQNNNAAAVTSSSLLLFTSDNNNHNNNHTSNNSCYWSPHSMFQYAFQTNSTVLGDVCHPTSLTIVLCLVWLLRSLKKNILLPTFSSLGRQAGRRTHGIDWERHNETRIVKFGEYVYRLLFHSMISIYGLLVFLDKEWWAREEGFLTNWVGTLHFFKGYPLHPIEPTMAWYYLVQAAYNTDAFLSLLELSFVVQFQSPFRQQQQRKKSSTDHDNNFFFFFDFFSNNTFRSPITIHWSEQVRGDFNEMAIHHLATNALVYGSSFFRFTRIGSMVFLIHDISDVPVDLSKLANFLKWKVTTVVCFLTMVLTWFLTRLYVLPFVVFRSVLLEAFYCLEYPEISPLQYKVWHPFFVTLLGLLILLHVTWFYMFLKIFWTLVRKRECHDYTEHKNGEKQKVV